MKKGLIALFASLAFNALGLLVNYRSYLAEKHLLLSYKVYGGEITSESGFGLRAIHTYSMMQGGSDAHCLRFSPLEFMLWLLIGMLAIWFILWLCGRLCKTKN